VSRLNNKRSGIVSSVIVSILLVTMTFLVVNNRQRILDQIAVWQFQSSSEVINLVDRSGMNDNGKFYYFASRPKLDATQEFNIACDRIEKTTSILGCYDGYNIYIYDVQDKQLDGIKEVTATHEALHAIYSRLNDSEIDKLNTLLELEYKKLEKNKEFAETVAFYERTEPGQRNNELHSMIGTEVSIIGSELELYYSKYFSNRQKVVDLYKKYNNVFESQNSRAVKLEGQINSLSSSVQKKINQYNIDTDVLNNDILNFNSTATSGQITAAQFNYEHNLLVNRLNILVEIRNNINNDLVKINQLIIEHNKIETESKKLYNSIDSSLVPAPSL